jgi:hypothetical protein
MGKRCPFDDKACRTVSAGIQTWHASAHLNVAAEHHDLYPEY